MKQQALLILAASMFFVFALIDAVLLCNVLEVLP